jgi:hypothetical protein
VNLSLFPGEEQAVAEAKGFEFHPTPFDVVRALVVGMRAAGHRPLPWHGRARDPAAGEGMLADHIDLLVPSSTRVWSFHEIRETAVARLRARRKDSLIHHGDFLSAVAAGTVERAELDVTNPPWSRAIEFAEVCLAVADHVALHVPLATVETPERVAFCRRCPADLYPLEWRPNYDGRGTVARAVCWLVWGPGRGGRWYPLTRMEAT